MTWTLISTDDGSRTFAHPRHGQTCHSRAGAWRESCERYALECRLREQARARPERALCVLDVGTGLGFNLAAALWALEGTGCGLDALSLEVEREVLVRTLATARSGELYDGAPAELVRFHAPVVAALERALADEAGAARAGVPLEVDGVRAGELRLLVGDARATLAATPRTPRFDAVFLDPFSREVEPELWQPGFLAEVAARMAPAAWLSTYSTSLAVRAALARAGLCTGPGIRVGSKASGTLARRTPELPAFDARTARRVARRAAETGRPPAGS